MQGSVALNGARSRSRRTSAGGRCKRVAVRVSARSGYDLEYMLKGQAGDGKERTAGGYYMNAAQAGEAPGRWYGAGAAALGFAPGSQVAPEPFRKVYSQVN